MAPIKLYKLEASPAVRAVYLAGEALGITFDGQELDMLKGEHMSPEYLKINPLHSVPAIDDNGFILCDSHVIISYLVGKFAKDDSLYPKDLCKRALVDQKLAFDLGTLYPLLKEIDVAYFEKRITCLSPKMVTDLTNTYNLLETMLKGKQWVAIDQITIADFSCYTTITCLDYHIPIESQTYPNIKNWMKRCRALPLFEKDTEKIRLFSELMKNFGA